jgi:hypothetical protein
MERLGRAGFIAILLLFSIIPLIVVDAQIVPTFTISISPSSLTVNQGDQASAYVMVTSINDFDGSVQLGFTGVPIGVQVSFSANPVVLAAGGQTSTSATFIVPSNVLPATYPMTLFGSASQQTKNYQFNLIVKSSGSPAEFTISVSPSSVAVQQETSAAGAATMTITSIGSYSSPVFLSYSGAPSGVTVGFSPNQVTPPGDGKAYSSVSIGVGSTSSGYYPITLTGVGSETGGTVITHSTQLTLQVVGPSADFSISVSPASLSVQRGGSASASVTVTSIGGLSSAVALSAAGIPSGMSVNFSPNPITPSSGSSTSSSISLSISSSSATGNYAITISGNSGSIVHPTTLTVTVTQGTAQDFSISPYPTTISISQGMSGTVLLTIASVNGFNSPVALGVVWVGTAPSGVTFTVPGLVTPPSGGTISASLTIATSLTSSIGAYTITATGSTSSLSHGVNIIVQIISGRGDFDLSIAPSTITLVQGSQTDATVTVQSSGAFYAPVTLTNSHVEGININFATNPVTPPLGGSATSQVALSAAKSVATGTYVITVTGSSGSFSHTATLTLIVNPTPTPDFSISASPTLLLINQGSTGTDTISVTSENGFSSGVKLLATWVSSAPRDVTFTLTGPIAPLPNQTTTSTMTVTALLDATTGNFTLRIVGTSGSLLHAVDITVQINALTTSTTTTVTASSITTPGTQCLIATATYGSELTPQVQFLRSFRDKLIMKTFAGSNFMTAFNTWYYSFSPSVARFISLHPTARMITRIALYPLIPILTIGADVFHTLPANQELAAVISGLLICSLLGVTYLAAPMMVMLELNSRARRTSKRIVGSLTIILLVALMFAGVAELFNIALLMALAASVVALSALVLSALLVSGAILDSLERLHAC